jgi:hypothetical protein
MPYFNVVSYAFSKSKKIDTACCFLANDNIEDSLYVDDFLIWYRGKNMNNIERQLQLCLNSRGICLNIWTYFIIPRWAEKLPYRNPSLIKPCCPHWTQISNIKSFKALIF